TYAGGKIYHPGKMGAHTTDPDHWSDFTTQGSGSPGGPFYSWQADTNGAYKWGAGTFDIETSNDTQLARHFAQKIKTYNNDQPFFMAMGLFRPHLPFNCHKDFFDLFNPDTLNIPQGYLENDNADILDGYNGTAQFEEINAEGQWKNAIRAYLANMAYADFNVGIVLDALSKSIHKDSTIIVFTGDHGWHLGEKDRMSKHAVFDQASRTTFIIYDPSAEGNGKISKKVVSLQDIYPTLVDLCGLPKRDAIQGESLKPLLNDPNSETWDFPVMMTYSGNNIIKTNKWRLIDKGDNSQLYDIENDPYEFNNLYNEPGYGPIISSLRQEIARFLEEGEMVKKNW
ncbi:MAG: sulfatase-like hydrolase/transferase, partial [Bacteroidota bacterium]